MKKIAYPLTDSQSEQIKTSIGWKPSRSDNNNIRTYKGDFVLGRTSYQVQVSFSVHEDKEIHPRVSFSPPIIPSLKHNVVSYLVLKDLKSRSILKAAYASQEEIFKIRLVEKLLSQNVILYGKLGNNEWSGSGFRINNDGVILTCAHCLDFNLGRQNSRKSEIYIGIGSNVYRRCKVLALNYDLDAGIISPVETVERQPWMTSSSWSAGDVLGSKSTICILGRSDDLQVGQEILKIGSPEGIFPVVTFGSIASELRQILDLKTNVFFIDLMITPGDSGSPVYDSTGVVVGMARGAVVDSSRYSGGVNYVVAVNELKKWLSEERIDFVSV